jgi:hypothetical protein
MMRKCSFLAMAPLLLAGCASSQPKHATVEGPVARQRPMGDSVLAATDPCAVRMQDISGAMLEYYMLNHHLPAVLQELRGFGDAGTDLNFTCPVSGKPYVYVPKGLSIPNVERLLVLYDAEPVHDGKSWGIVVAPQVGTKPMMAWVIQLNARLLQAYINGAPAPESIPVPVNVKK